MKNLAVFAFVVCGALLIATPFIYAMVLEVNVEGLVDEFITYISMGAGIASLVMGYKALVSSV